MESRNGNAATARNPKNDIVNIPPEDMKQWDEKVRNGEVQECRVIFVGPGDSGKSSLIRRILKDEPPEYPTMPDGTRTGPEDNTKGIAISYGCTCAIRDKTKRYRVKFMDFGGQTTQTFIHRCFMAPYAVYVLVCALANENSGYPVETVKEWLEDINAYDRSGGSPVIVALNKVDLDTERLLVEDWETTRKDITTSSKVAECLRTSALRDRNDDNAVEDLILAIRNQIPKSLSGSQKKVSQNWLNVRRAMESPPADYIFWNEYIKLCKDFHIIRRRKLLNWLTEQGVVYCYGSFKRWQGAQPIMVLSPEWLAERIYAIINSEADTGAFVSHGKIGDILLELRTGNADGGRRDGADSQFDVNAERECVLSMMREFDLSLLWDGEKELIPDRIQNKGMPPAKCDCVQWKTTQSDSKLQISILRYLMRENSNDLSQELMRDAAEFYSYEKQCRLYVMKDDSAKGDETLAVYLQAGDAEKLKDYLQPFCESTRKYLKKRRVAFTESVFWNGQELVREDLKKKRAEVIPGTECTGRDIWKRFYPEKELPPDKPLLMRLTERVDRIRPALLIAAKCAMILLLLLVSLLVFRAYGWSRLIIVAGAAAIAYAVIRTLRKPHPSAEDPAKARLTNIAADALLFAFGLLVFVIFHLCVLKLTGSENYQDVLDFYKDILPFIGPFVQHPDA